MNNLVSSPHPEDFEVGMAANSEYDDTFRAHSPPSKEIDNRNIMTTTQASRLHLDQKNIDSEDVKDTTDLSKLDATKMEIAKTNPGMRLRHIREQKNISVQQIADNLYLAPTIIQALENDDYESLPSAVFIRGYLRNYAKLLEVPPDSILEVYEQQMGEKKPLPALKPQLKEKDQTTSSDIWVKAVTIVIVLTVFILIGLWAIPMGQQTKKPTETPERNNATNSGEAIPLPALPATPTSPVTPTPITAPVPVTAPKPAEVTEEDKADKDPNMLKLTAVKESSIRIFDSKGKELYNKTLNAGGHISVTGSPPFRVRATNIDGVKIEYKGEKKDLKIYPKHPKFKNSVVVGGSE